MEKSDFWGALDIRTVWLVSNTYFRRSRFISDVSWVWELAFVNEIIMLYHRSNRVNMIVIQRLTLGKVTEIIETIKSFVF